MRIIAGKWRSRRVLWPNVPTGRPMSDRLREGIYNILGSYYGCPGSLPSLRVADVFAGSGSLGLEALSRGVLSCCFYERDRAALDLLRQNLAALGVDNETTIVAGNAWTNAIKAPDGQVFELILLDPPYADSDDASDDGPVRRYLENLAQLEADDSLVVLHHRAGVDYDMSDRPPWKLVDRRTMGTNAVTILAR